MENEARIAAVEQLLITTTERQNSSMLEKHAQTVIVFVILGVLSWVGYSMLKANVSIEVLKNDMTYMKNSIDKVTNNYVTTIEFHNTAAAHKQNLIGLESRVRTLEENSKKK